MKQFHRLGDPSTIYGGMFDLVNTQELSEADLKFAALFYDAVVVPDAFLMSYTPLFRHVDQLVETHSDPAQDIISIFLKEGIIVPAIRDGDSLLVNWTRSIAPATEMRVRKEEGRKVLEFVDRNVTRYTKIDLKSRNRLADLLNQFMVGEEKPFSTALSRMGSSELHSVSHLFRTFGDLVQGGLENSNLRRLDIERLISQYLIRHHDFHHRRGFIPELYQKLTDAAASNPRDPGLFGCQFLLNSSSTIYQAYHAHQFGALGGLFPLHDRSLIDAGLYTYLTGIPTKVIEQERKTKVKRSPVLFGSFDVGKFTPRQIADIRNTDEFREHVAHLAAWKTPKSGETGYDANPAFVDHLKGKYLPLLMRDYPKAVWIERSIKGVAAGTEVLLELVDHLDVSDSVLVNMRPIVSVMKGAARTLAHYSEGIAHSLHSMRMNYRQKKGLNQYWTKTPPR